MQSQANMELAKVTSDRSAVLVRQGWTSRQQGDQDRLTLASSAAAVNVAQANLQAQQAQVDRMEELTSFERVVAPFDGVITARNTDVGALINAGAGSPGHRTVPHDGDRDAAHFRRGARDLRSRHACGRGDDGDAR